MSEKTSKESKREEEAGLGDAREKKRHSRDRKKNWEEKGSEMGFRERRLRAEVDSNYKNHFLKRVKKLMSFTHGRVSTRKHPCHVLSSRQHQDSEFTKHWCPFFLHRETAILKYHF